MSSSAVTAGFSLRQAFEAEQARRESERRARDEAERRQQQEDLARAEELYDALVADPAFLHAHKLTVDWRRYSVHLESSDFRIRAYFEAGQATVTVGDKRHVAVSSSPAPLKSEEVGSVADALAVVARFLADEIQ
ncbi:MAG: hypothetical protein JWR47_3205 [Phenylobacterium sp.]|jgi:hypothetical protein|uniref:hypothetical protein n=1 Tax=Phenylobacterium sp. TaxID=1871053 RepID=UPI00261A214B|nr:hypothetical protein [Phenylobacterium sp.]MDB5427547.1 hypothetical protein [Phenylobacterium sp.]MDB5436948.1 hypothetical protein [Phenylobacterium sp.]MDB5463522.1 hypothetical protein [Phenylobacterium sp.]MDB5499981.1 hypothetical protein [Phenylobacterium sp.]